MRFYLDTCSLNRPWDDQRQVRIHLESESVVYLLHEARLGRMEFVISDYLLDELTPLQSTTSVAMMPSIWPLLKPLPAITSSPPMTVC